MNVPDEYMYQAINGGTLIGRTEPDRHSKYSWWQVYWFEDKALAVVFDEENGAICAEEVLTTEALSSYVDDVDAALDVLEHIRNGDYHK